MQKQVKQGVLEGEEGEVGKQGSRRERDLHVGIVHENFWRAGRRRSARVDAVALGRSQAVRLCRGSERTHKRRGVAKRLPAIYIGWG